MPESSAIDWPEDVLGCAARQAYRAAPGARFRVIEVQDGPSRLRLIQDEIKRDYNMQFNWDGDQLTAFALFYHDTLNAGSEWFHMKVLTGLGMIPHICHFNGAHSIVPVSEKPGLFVASFVVETYASSYVIPPPYVQSDPADAGTPADEYADSYDARAVTDTRPTDRINALTPKAHA